MRNFKSIKEYIQHQPETIQLILTAVKEAIEKACPEAIGSISYDMPAYKLDGKPLAYFAANKNHLGFYPTPSPIDECKDELAGYKTSKGAVQFRYDEKLPVALITKMVKFRVKQIDESRKTK